MSQDRSMRYSLALFLGVIFSLVLLSMTVGRVTRELSRISVKDEKLSYEYQFEVEAYLAQEVVISVPGNSTNASLSLVHFDLFGNKIIEEREFTSKSTIMILELGKHSINLKYDLPINESIQNLNEQVIIQRSILPYLFSEMDWMVISLVLSLVFFSINYTFFYRGVFTNQIMRDYKLLIKLLTRFQDELTSKQLMLENIEDRVDSNSHISGIEELRTIKDVESFFSKHSRILGVPQEAYAALILQAILNVSNDIKESAFQFKPSIAFSLAQTLGRNLISSYEKRVSNLIETLVESTYAHTHTFGVHIGIPSKHARRIRYTLDRASNMMQVENVYVKISRVTSASAISLLALIALKYQPADFIVLKLPLFFYTICNFLGFIINLM